MSYFEKNLFNRSLDKVSKDGMSPDKMSRTKWYGQNVARIKCPRKIVWMNNLTHTSKSALMKNVL